MEPLWSDAVWIGMMARWHGNVEPVWRCTTLAQRLHGNVVSVWRGSMLADAVAFQKRRFPGREARKKKRRKEVFDLCFKVQFLLGKNPL